MSGLSGPSGAFRLEDPHVEEVLYLVFAQHLANMGKFLARAEAKTWVLRQTKMPDGDVMKYSIETYCNGVPKIKKKEASRASDRLFLGQGCHGQVFRQIKERNSFVKKIFKSSRSSNLDSQGKLTDLFRALKFDLREFLIFGQRHGKPGVTYRFAADGAWNHYYSRMTLPYLGSSCFSIYTIRGQHLCATPQKWFRYFSEACHQLSSLHAMKIAHLDVKPTNMVFSLSLDGRLSLIDFGSALFEREFQNSRKEQKTTGWYRPVEAFMKKASGQNHGYWTDVYSVAASFLQVLGLNLVQIFELCEDSSPDCSGIEEILANFLRDKFETVFLKPAGLQDSVIKSCSALLKSMMAFYSEDRFSYVYLKALGDYFLCLAEALSPRSAPIFAPDFPRELQAEIDRSEKAVRDRALDSLKFDDDLGSDDAEDLKILSKIFDPSPVSAQNSGRSSQKSSVELFDESESDLVRTHASSCSTKPEIAGPRVGVSTDALALLSLVKKRSAVNKRDLSNQSSGLQESLNESLDKKRAKCFEDPAI